jgi:putative membrane protein
MMWYWNGGWNWWGWLEMTVFMVIFWGLMIWGIVTLVRYLNAPGPRDTSSGERRITPEAILAERFARGEIDEGEYAHKRDILRGAGQGADGAGIDETSREREREVVAR